MARPLYREWLFHFRFPRLRQSEMVPPSSVPSLKAGRWLRSEAFSRRCLAELPRAKAEYWQNGTVPWISSGKVNELRIIEPVSLSLSLRWKSQRQS